MNETVSLAMTLEELEREITRLEDIQAIKELQMKYGYYMDSHHRQEVFDLFSEDTESIEIESTGLFLGKEGVRKFFLDNDLLQPGQSEVPGWVNIRIFMDQPVIDIDPSGTTAKGRWSTWLAEAMVVGGIPRQQWVHGYYVFKFKSSGIFGHTTHILGVASRIANLAWQRYQFTKDKEWLRERAYPLIKGAAEFYRNFPNLRKEDDGRYHIHHTNSGESAWNSKDAPYEVACMHMIFPLVVRASEELGVDAGLRPAWRDIKQNLVPAPPGAQCGTGSELATGRPFGAFVYNGPGAIEPVGPEPELKSRFLGFTRLGSFIDVEGIGGAQIFRNRLRLREGPGAIDAEHIGGLSAGLHATMLDSRPDAVTGEPISIFNRWPKDWDAAFQLLASGGFLVSSAQIGGSIPLVEIVSQLGGTCRFKNPWSGDVQIHREGRAAETVSGPVLSFPARKGETVVLAPKGAALQPVKML